MRSVFEGVEEETRRDEERERDHDDDGHTPEILGHIAAFPRGRALEIRRRRADSA